MELSIGAHRPSDILATGTKGHYFFAEDKCGINRMVTQRRQKHYIARLTGIYLHP